MPPGIQTRFRRNIKQEEKIPDQPDVFQEPKKFLQAGQLFLWTLIHKTGYCSFILTRYCILRYYANNRQYLYSIYNRYIDSLDILILIYYSNSAVITKLYYVSKYCLLSCIFNILAFINAGYINGLNHVCAYCFKGCHTE